MKMNKTYYPIVAASCLAFGALAPMSSGDESRQSQTATPTQAAKADRLVNALKERIVDPLNEQAKLFGHFSRREPTHTVSYFLVENAAKSPKGQRNFSVMLKQTPILKGAKETNSEYLKLRHTAKGDQVLIKSKDSWVTPEEHPVMKRFVKPTPAPVPSS